MLRKAFFLYIAVAACNANADMYKCVTPDGGVSYQQKPCPSTETTEWKEADSRPAKFSNPLSEWLLLETTDQMTDEKVCVLKSPNIFMGSKGQDFYMVSLRIGEGPELGSFVVGIKSEKSFSDNIPIFHTDTSDLGIRIDNHPLQRVDESSQSKIVGFDVGKSAQLIRQLETASQIRLRLRFWPYDTRYDAEYDFKVSPAKHIDKLKSCIRASRRD